MPICVVRLVSPGLYPCIQQHVAGTGIETGYGTVLFQQADVGDAADVDHSAGNVLVTEDGQMKSRHKWCALTAGGDITTPEIGDDIDSGQFGKRAGLLVCRVKPRSGRCRIVCPCTPIACISEGNTAFSGQFFDVFCIKNGQSVGGQCFSFDFVFHPEPEAP